MQFIADILMTAGAIAAGLYCFVLARRLRRFTDLEQGVGGAIAVLSAQVDDMTKTLSSAQTTAAGSAAHLEELTGRSEAVAKRLELLIASMHDLPDDPKPTGAATPSAKPEAQGSLSNPGEAKPEKEALEALFLSHRTRAEAAQ
ncbi:hypothetical protein AQS8620_00172 [Aquimixticola soesokkakensis]|uniref:Uncharacterized protein n=1 Tax=Aquimixticola soesokkakensis TaxID=1519096 RepID=A0A1Y5RAX9_9RHOB|nr:hypothetical protein [Aquimixticola soesokkakensis]SLN13172.1 hypothetical protein AQS8620_00172 [Aquimixticola soesokkakensis]